MEWTVVPGNPVTLGDICNLLPELLVDFPLHGSVIRVTEEGSAAERASPMDPALPVNQERTLSRCRERPWAGRTHFLPDPPYFQFTGVKDILALLQIAADATHRTLDSQLTGVAFRFAIDSVQGVQSLRVRMGLGQPIVPRGPGLSITTFRVPLFLHG
jgi:hypothetical protein